MVGKYKVITFVVLLETITGSSFVMNYNPEYKEAVLKVDGNNP